MGRPPKLGFPEADTTPKNQRLSIAQLAAYDDLLTDALVDKVCTDAAINVVAPHL